tara:strand:+ start:270 stop:1091 length:822 start_codon:yes stop_codon:yes gene_type:complete
MAATVEFNGKKITDKLDLLVQVQLPWISTLTLNGKRGKDLSLASQVQDDLRDHMRSTFKNIGRETTKFIVFKSTKQNLETTVKHKDEAPQGTPPSEYLKPQIVGGPVKRQKFQKALAERSGLIRRTDFIMPIKNDQPAFGKVKGGEYVRALWGIKVMENFRGTERFIGKTNYRTAGSYVHVPRGLAQWAEFDPAVKPKADMIRALNKKAGKGFRLPPSGIYQVKGRGLDKRWQQLDYIPQAKANHYKFRSTANESVSKNFERIFRQKVKEVLG